MAGEEGGEPLAALAALRAHLIKGKGVSVEGEELVLADVGGGELRRFPKHAPTAYRSKNSDKRYDLLAVYTCFKYAALTFSDYVMKCRAEKATMVSTVDKKELIAYLKGDIETSPQIVGGARSAGSNAPAGGKTKAAGANDDEHASKKRKLAGDSHRDKENNHRRCVRLPLNSSRPLTYRPQQGRGERLHGGRDRHQAHPGQGARLPQPDDHAGREQDVRERAQDRRGRERREQGAHREGDQDGARGPRHGEEGAAAAPPPHEGQDDWCEMAGPAGLKSTLLSTNAPFDGTGTPIIVVPAGFSDLFTILNARDFLEEGVYISNMQKKSEGCRKAQSIVITHEEDGHTYTFKVVDSVARFRDKDWCARFCVRSQEGDLTLGDDIVGAASLA